MRRLPFCVLVVLQSSLFVRALDAAEAATQYRVQSATTKTGGTLATDEVWTVDASPYEITGSLKIPDKCTLTIEPGVSVYLDSGVNITVADGGRILAEGTETQGIRFTSPPDSSSSWGRLTIGGSSGSPETRLAYVYFAGNGKTCIEVDGGTLYLDHATFGTTTHQYLSLDSSSFVVSHCYFPTGTGSFELVHGTGGIKSGGYGIVRDSFFGHTNGYNDVMDFTGGNRESGQPIIQYYNNVFIGSSDDILDLDGTDAWIEGNIFLHAHRNGAPDSSAAISGGDNGGRTSEITILGNLIFDCDNAATAKQGNFYTLINNTIVHTTKEGGVDFASGVVTVRDTTPSLTAFGAGCYLEGNIIVDAEQLVRNYDPDQTTVTLNDNILPMPWNGPGSGNIVVDPQLDYIPQVSETYFSSWDEAQIMRNWFGLRPGSAARGIGPNGTDCGGVIPPGVSISGNPAGTTNRTSATLTVGVDCTGSGIPEAGFPLGSGFTSYRWRLDGGTWSDETPITVPIELAGLANGTHSVEVIGRNDAGFDENDPLLGQDAVVTTSVWTVDDTYSRLVIDEVLANNVSAVANGDSYPDMVELYYDGPSPLDMSGMTMTNDANDPSKFVFPAGTTMAPGERLVLYADADVTSAVIHLGFALADQGDALCLYAANGTLIDCVEFGRQLPDLSIGRIGRDGQWRLTVPTLGEANVACPVGNPDNVKINEWLTEGQVLFAYGFVELYNPQANPVDVGGMTLTDESVTAPPMFEMKPLSFMAANGYVVLWADESNSPRLSSNGGTITLRNSDLMEVDEVLYGPQTSDVSEGRVPDGASQRDFFPLPTPGIANPVTYQTTTTALTLVDEFADKRALVPTGPISEDWKGGNPFDDSTWALCQGAPGGIGYDTGSDYRPLIGLDLGAQMSGSGKNTTCYIRVPFTVAPETLANVDELTLKLRCDDGFVAYLNGSEVARGNFSGTPAWDSHADSAIETSVSGFDTVVDVSAHKDLLKPGENVLAIHGMNAGSSSSDFLICVVMDARLVNVEEQAVLENELNLIDGLRITELMYDSPQGDDGDYIEFENVSNKALDVNGVRLSQGADFVFPAITLLPGDRTVVVANLAAFQSAYGATLNIAGQYSGSLSDSGAQIVLQLPAPLDAAILRFNYSGTWYPPASGDGESLSIRNPAAASATWNDPASWLPTTPTPGQP
jgi:hypothetical protein